MTSKQKREMVVGTKFVPPYSILFMAELEEAILRKTEFKPSFWWKYIDDLCFLWEYGEENLRSFINDKNKVHPTIKLIVEWSKTKIKFLYVMIIITEGIIETDLRVKPTDSYQYSLSSSYHPFSL